MSRVWSVLGLMLLVVDRGEPASRFRYQRSVAVRSVGASCAVLDPSIYAHAAEALTDLRLLGPNGIEVPYVLTVSGTGAESVTVPVRNLTGRKDLLTFDLEMPTRPYTDVVLDLASTDFVAAATVSGRDPASSRMVQLGQFALFDLSAQHLPRSTVLHLQETTLPVLHVELRSAHGSRTLRPEMVRGATVPPSREAQTLYTSATASSDVRQRGQETVVSLDAPPRVPIERVLITLQPTFRGDFNRAVRIEARHFDGAAHAEATEPGERETLVGAIARLHLTRDGLLLKTDQMGVPAILGANLQTAATVEVVIENGIGAPLPVSSVELQTRERRICFEAPAAAGPLRLFYGDPHLHAPVYAEALLPLTTAAVQPATLGAEQRNPLFAGQPERRPVLRRHPRLFSLGFVLAVCLSGVIALRSAKLRL